MRMDLITKLAKRGIIQQQQQRLMNDRKTHACYTLTRSYYSLIKIRAPKTPHCFTNQFLQKSSSYSTSASSNHNKGGFVAWYLGMLESRPILTKAVSSSLIYAAADLTSQMITMPPSGSFDLIRTMRMTGFGFLFLGPMQHVWFNFVARVLPMRDVVATLKKIVMGQVVLGPIVLSTFFSFNAALQGESSREIAARLKRDMLPTMINGLIFWPVCDFLTYKVIPVRLQPLINSTFAYVWSIYLTYMASLEKAVQE